MSEPTPREALRERLIHHLRDDRAVFSAATGLYPEVKPMLDNLEKFICTEVLAVLNELEEKGTEARTTRGGMTLMMVGTGWIKQLKQRYGGEEQGNDLRI